jgi:cytochrome c553
MASICMGRSEGTARHRLVATAAMAAILSAGVAEGDAVVAEGKALYIGCTACHGVRGEGVAAVGAPGIGGMSAAYVTRQLRNFASGARGAQAGDGPGAAMRAAIVGITTDAQRVAVAAYVATLPRARIEARPADTANGRNYFNALCSACHGSDGAGNEALNAPRLAGLPAAYLERQLTAFRAGQRGAQNADHEGAQMRTIANMLPDAATVHDVARYSAELGSR